MSQTAQDTIVAIATPPGEGAIGIVRLSGPSAIAIASEHVELPFPLHKLPNFRIRLATLKLEDRLIDEILIFLTRNPNSYTGEDTVEFQCHGSPVLLNQLVRSLVAAGARSADPGEFTKRAYMNGRIDLTQAEAVADLISARTDFGLESAFFQLRGGLKSRFAILSDELRQTKTLIEATLDFSEDVSLDPERVSQQLAEAMEILNTQIDSYATGKLIRQGASVALCGRPNVGKSSLMNALLGQDRAIVTNIPGTTRDTIEESIEIQGLQVKLTDTAGIRRTDDPVEQEGTRRSDLAIEASDLTLLVCDASAPPTVEDLDLLASYPECLLVLNKSDLLADPEWHRWERGQTSVRISATEGNGLNDLREGIGKSILAEREVESEQLTNERHVIDLKKARSALERARSAVIAESPGEVISLEIDESLIALSSIVGKTTAQDILDRIFSQFCIGK